MKFHPSLGEMLRALRAQGAAWVINTGRTLDQTLHGLGQYGILMEPDFIIAQECDIHRPGFWSRWTDYGSWNRRARKLHNKFMKENQPFLDALKQMVESQTKAQFLKGDFGQVGLVASSTEEMDQLCTVIEKERTRFPTLSYQRNGIYLRFSHVELSKGSALGELARLLDLNASACFAAGDNYNDLSMLDTRFAKMIACPGNALPPIKEHVRRQGGFVAEGTASFGMMEALGHYFAAK
jgi:hydroxymethylpyrimidine pyrophosphatase-like HAD family hydrolase